MKKRILISTISGAILGIFCIIGVGTRLGFSSNEMFLLATWWNRLLMGFVIGFVADWQLIKSKNNSILRGAIMGLIISFTFYLSTGFTDFVGFLAGIVYGIIIDYVATKYSK